MRDDLTRSVTAAGGKVLGSALHPIGSTDLSSFLLQAQASSAQVVGILNAGSDLINSVKQAAEFGLTLKQKFFLPGAVISDVHSLGLEQAQGLPLMSGFYWDRNDESRARSRAFFDRTKRMPGQIQAGTYSAVRHFLQAAQASGSIDGPAVAEKMRATPVNDVFVHDGHIRPDGRVMHDLYIVQVKSPAESKAPWDYYKQVGSIAGERAMQPLAETRCPLPEDMTHDERSCRLAACLISHSDALAAGHFDSLRVDPAVVLRKQACDHRPDVVWQAGAAEGGHVREQLVDVRVVADAAAAEIGLDRTGRHRVDRDAAPAQLLCHVAGEHLDRALHARIGGVAGKGRAGQAGGQVHDAPAVRNQRQQRLHQEVDPLEVATGVTQLRNEVPCPSP